MIGADEIRLLHPQWLLLLPPAWLLLWLYARRLRRGTAWRRLCDPHLLAYMTATQKPVSRQPPALWIFGTMLTLGIVAAAAPSWSRVSGPLFESNSARVIVLDLSRAMLVEDLRPNRYRHAVEAASALIGNDFDGETGLVVFAGAAFVLSPLSRDADTLQAFVEAVSPETMPRQGSNLEQAISMARDLLGASPQGRGRILLISAGDSDDDGAVRAASEAAAQGHRVSVLAIGSPAGGPLRDDRGGLLRDGAGKVRISRGNFKLLQRIAAAGQGTMMINAADAGDPLSTSLDANLLAEASRNPGTADGDAADDGFWLLSPMLPLALLLFRRQLLLVMLLILVLPAERSVYADEPRSPWTHPERVAFHAYQRGEFETVIEISANPDLRGSAYYRRGLFSRALEQFGEPGEDGSANRIYNRANTLVQLQRYAQAAAAYRRALEIEPGFEAARHNQRLLELFLKQREQASDSAGDPGGDGEPAQTQSRQVGIATDPDSNPADDQQAGPGTGAGQQFGQVDPVERFDGADDEPARFVLRARDPAQAPSPEFIERWISALPETSTELYRRKFLRDFMRQQRQPR